MPRIAIEEYDLEIIAEPGEQAYDYSYGDVNGEYHWSSSILLRTYKSDRILKTVFVTGAGGGTGVHENSFIAKKDRIAICCADSIFCLSIPDLGLLWRTQGDTATCFGIFTYKDDYIEHGELEISRLDAHGKILWQQSGADIFTRLDAAEDDFAITDDHILATDWGGRKYKFDSDGNLIN